jgi:hypothetical protein
MKQKQKRTALVKGYITDENKADLQAACTAMRKTVSDVLNECTIVIIRNHLDTRPKRNDTPPFSNGARPKSGNSKAQFPASRPSFGLVPRVIRLRV